MGTVLINSECQEWASDWADGSGQYSKPIYVTVSGDDGPIAGVKAELAVSQGSAELTYNTEAVTTSQGVVTYLVTFSNIQSNTIVLTATADTGNGGSSTASRLDSAELLIEFVESSLAAPRIPVALDGVIDDDDVTSGATALLTIPDMNPGNQIILCWDGFQVEESVITVPSDNTYVIDLSARESTLLTNGVHYVRFYAVDNLGNGRFSAELAVFVNRYLGGGGDKILDQPALPLAENDGYINHADMVYGVAVSIPAEAYEEQNILQSLQDAVSGIVHFVGCAPDGTVLPGVVYSLELGGESEPNAIGPAAPAVGESYISQTTLPPEFLESIGEGEIKITYDLSVMTKDIDGNELGVISFSSKERTYIVDVIPPGSL